MDDMANAVGKQFSPFRQIKSTNENLSLSSAQIKNPDRTKLKNIKLLTPTLTIGT